MRHRQVCTATTSSKKRKINKFPLTVPHNLQKLKVVKLLYLCRCVLLTVVAAAASRVQAHVCMLGAQVLRLCTYFAQSVWMGNRMCDKYKHTRRRCRRRKPLRTYNNKTFGEEPWFIFAAFFLFHFFVHEKGKSFSSTSSFSANPRSDMQCIHLTYFLSSQLLWVSPKNEVNMTSHKNLFTVERPLFEWSCSQFCVSRNCSSLENLGEIPMPV